MGNENGLDKGMKIYIKQEFDRVKANKDRKHLLISEVLKLQHPENYPFTFVHLGTLFVLDNTQSGKVTYNSLLQFGQFCATNLKSIQTYEFQSHLQAMTTSILWDSMCKNGTNSILVWLELLLIENEEPVVFPNQPNVKFIRIDTVKVFYEIFNLKIMSSIDIQQFFDLLQQCGEELGLMALDQEELDEFVPVSVCINFARDFLKGFRKLMIEIGLDDAVE